HAPQQVAALGVGGLGDGLLEAVERRLELAGVPVLEAPRERSGAVAAVAAERRGEPSASGEPLGLEITGDGLQDRQGLLVLAAAEQKPPELSRRRGISRIELE